MIGLDLFTGYGGISLAIGQWVRPVAYCEIDPYCRGVLLSRMADGRLPRAPIWDDVTTLEGCQFAGMVDIVYGGFPCQDISVAGRGVGLAGERSGLFFEILRLAKEIKPAFVFLENVPAIRTRGLDRVVRELSDLGYDCRWDHLSAYDVGAPHKRDRWFLLAYSSRFSKRKPANKTNAESTSWEAWHESGHGGAFGNPDIAGLEIGESREPREQPSPIGTNWWESEPDVGRVVNGCPARVDRIRSLGNGVVPAQAREAFRRLMGISDEVKRDVG